ncbi:MAG: bidirectional hydrogenase complex protein HoxU [Opitutus sp.]|nr:bidirectional hydrogenase complex protein HoxU [Opitutus sp.]
MAVKTLTIDGRALTAQDGDSLLDVCRDAGIALPTLCHLDGVLDIGACRLCLVEIAGSPKLFPACTTLAAEGMDVQTNTPRLQCFRRLALELLLAERNHVCAVCVANGQCELQSLAAANGVDHVRYEYQTPRWPVDQTHALFGMDHNRCILCTRCVRACWHIEGAGTKNTAGRGARCEIITDLRQPWGDADSCTSCGKCVMSCPTGALFYRGATAGEMVRDHSRLGFIVNAREKKQWNA